VGLLYVLFVGVAMLALPMAIKGLPKVVGDIGLYTLLGSLVAIFLTAGRHKKGILGKFTGGFGGLYGLVNLFSDVLSYARIFGIALAGGAIASAFNAILGVVVGIPYAGYPIAIVLGIALHVFNLLISLLGAYVHNARLQFLEFYGKFYTGEGRQFTPMGEKTKYIRFY
jgi:V/A-type H+-transporting ATPase subunit I